MSRLRLPLLLLLVLECLLYQSCAHCAPEKIRLRLFENYPNLVRLNIKGPFIRDGHFVYEPGEFEVLAQEDGLAVFQRGARLPSHRAKRLSIAAFQHDPVTIELEKKRRRYQGQLHFIWERPSASKPAHLLVIEELTAKDYVEGVVGSETLKDWPPEALKAQAVLTQTRLEHYQPDKLLGDSTQSEAYLGFDYERPGVREAVQAVWGAVLMYQGSAATVFYHAACAGATSRGVDIFGDSAKSMPYLASVKCDFCKDSPFFKPTTTFIDLTSFKRQFGGGAGSVIPHVEAVDGANRPLKLTLAPASDQNSSAQTMSGYQFWIKLGQKFGWDKAPGTRFTLSQKGDQIEVSSTGAGHGVGMCQWGAAGRARAGWKYQDILKYYFPGTQVVFPGRKGQPGPAQP